jgi:hypothetical protein
MEPGPIGLADHIGVAGSWGDDVPALGCGGVCWIGSRSLRAEQASGQAVGWMNVHRKKLWPFGRFSKLKLTISWNTLMGSTKSAISSRC